MYSVDLTGIRWLNRLFPNHSVDFASLTDWDDPEDRRRFRWPSGVQARSIITTDSEIDWDSYCVVLFWGDFQHSACYISQDATKRLSRKHQMVPGAATLLAIESLFLIGVPDHVLGRVIVFGETLLPDAGDVPRSPIYIGAFDRLFSNCHAVFLRDPISAFHLQRVRIGRHVYSGIDPAFFLEAMTGTTSVGASRPPSVIGLFWTGRSRAPIHLRDFIRALKESLDLPVCWIPWLPPISKRKRSNPIRKVFNRVFRHHSALFPDLGIQAPLGFSRRQRSVDGVSWSELLQSIRESRCVVTDAYHLCVNAWRDGTPAICIEGAQGDYNPSTLNSTKTRVLYSMMRADAFWVGATALKTSSEAKLAARRLAELIRSGVAVDSVRSVIGRDIKRVAAAFEEEISKLVPISEEGRFGSTAKRNELEKAPLINHSGVS